MAGEWIPMRLDLADDPAVIRISARIGLDEYAVVGRLHRLWVWANNHTVDGNAVGVTEMWVDRYVNATGFAAAMAEAGWLTINEGGITLPKFENWNSKSAKKRLLTARRVQKSRSEPCNADSVTKALPEKRRVEKKEKTEDPPTPQGGGVVSSSPADAVEIPAELDTASFRAVWDRWRKYRGSKLKPMTQEGQLKKLAAWGHDGAIRAIEQSIEQGWQGLFEPKENGRGPPPRQSHNEKPPRDTILPPGTINPPKDQVKP